jgi:hypothetical protein
MERNNPRDKKSKKEKKNSGYSGQTDRYLRENEKDIIFPTPWKSRVIHLTDRAEQKRIRHERKDSAYDICGHGKIQNQESECRKNRTIETNSSISWPFQAQISSGSFEFPVCRNREPFQGSS